MPERREVEDAIGHSDICERLIAGEDFDDSCDCPAAEGASRVIALLDRAPDTAPAEAAVCGLLVAEYGFLPRNNSLPRRIVRAALAAPPAPTTTDAAEDGETPISTWQARAGHWTDTRFPADTIKDRGLILGEEVGEVMRCIVKADQNIRGGTDHWNAELRKEAIDVFFGLVALAHRAGFDLSTAIEEAWPAIDAKVFVQGPAAASSSHTADAAKDACTSCSRTRAYCASALCCLRCSHDIDSDAASSCPVSDPAEAAEGLCRHGFPLSTTTGCAPAASPDAAAGEA